MPMWVIYHPPSTFTSDAEKSALAAAITEVYTAANLPKFFYVGGIPRPSPHLASNEPGGDTSVPFIRITIQNIARKIETENVRTRFLTRVDAALKPHIEDKGYDWEYSVLETSRDLWKVNGLVPPLPGTEGEELWKKENRAVKL
ncbi:hypothetical protein DM02DRAFT_540594 [Periconia macrospinosa]|uniref:Tautomerase cis-CaaD-like domain-containing protein n=1 Tax=Periconia macrospinosa TaxID=97972 RepID=A0A2V1D730_9PLEO|nr:hypothetical protein DM02DRAFT_540594 [Periconia macrospinosa]